VDQGQQAYTSRLTTILTMIGVAVGLGNVWRFPYMMGSYGGSAFLVVYLIFTVAFAIPALMAEIALGRETEGGTVVAFVKSFGKKWGAVVGFALMATVLIATSYYAVVISNVVYTAGYSIFSGFKGDHITTHQEGLANGWLQYGIAILLLVAALFVVHKGLRKGIEWLSKLFVPFFLLVIIYLIYYVFTLPGSSEKLMEFLQPDLGALTMQQTFAALGQSFYSVGLGGTFIVVYGRYLKKNESIPKIAAYTCLGDVGASLLVSLFLVPAILVFGLDMSSGPGLIFSTLPQLFAQMPGGQFIGSLFMIALSFVAFLSMVAGYEVFTSSVDKEVFPQIDRKKIILAVGIIQLILIAPTTFYPSLIGTLDMIFGSGMQVLGSILSIIGLVWGLGKVTAIRQIFTNSPDTKVAVYSMTWLKWVMPIVLLTVLIGYVYGIALG
jgi:neurotransmitter:Na+ symporter, NSS family